MFERGRERYKNTRENILTSQNSFPRRFRVSIGDDFGKSGRKPEIVCENGNSTD